MTRLQDKVAIVTGGARGMGAAVVRSFLAHGARVCVADVDVASGEELMDALPDARRRGEVFFQSHDVSDEGSWSRLVDDTLDRWGQVDVLVNNAGILRFGALGRTPLTEAQQVWAVNIQGCFLGMQAVTPHMRRRGGGSIVNTSSIEGLAGMGHVVAYCGSKWAVRGMTKAAAHELGPHGIRVNSVHPGMVDTPMTRAHGGDDAMAAGGAKVPLRRVGEAEDVVGAYVFLASDESGYVTGAELAVDGGATATHVFGA